MSTMTISDLRTKRAETWEKAKAFLDERRDTTTGCLSTEDDAQYSRMESEIDKLTNEIARAERAQRLDADLGDKRAKRRLCLAIASPGRGPATPPVRSFHQRLKFLTSRRKAANTSSSAASIPRTASIGSALPIGFSER